VISTPRRPTSSCGGARQPAVVDVVQDLRRRPHRQVLTRRAERMPSSRAFDRTVALPRLQSATSPFNRQGDLLAYTVDAQVRDGNGLFVLDLRNGRTNVLDNDTLQYNRLTWSDDGNRLAILKGRPVERMRERDNVLLALSGLRTVMDDPEITPSRLDPSKAAGFPKGFVISDRAPLSFSEDGRRVFLGIIPQSSAPDTAGGAARTRSPMSTSGARTTSASSRSR
jgi:hypothetical protein